MMARCNDRDSMFAPGHGRKPALEFANFRAAVFSVSGALGQAAT